MEEENTPARREEKRSREVTTVAHPQTSNKTAPETQTQNPNTVNKPMKPATPLFSRVAQTSISIAPPRPPRSATRAIVGLSYVCRRADFKFNETKRNSDRLASPPATINIISIDHRRPLECRYLGFKRGSRSSGLPKNAGIRWCTDCGRTSLMASKPVVAIPPACSTIMAIGLPS